MQKLFILIFVSFYTLSFSQAAFVKGGHSFTFGYGIPNLHKIIIKENLRQTDIAAKKIVVSQGSSFTYSSTGRGPFFFKYDYNLTDKIGLGLVIGYYDISVTESYNYSREVFNIQKQINERKLLFQAVTRSVKSTSIGLRFNYHFGNKNRFDPYVAFALGYTNGIYEQSFASNDPNILKQPIITHKQTIPLYIGATIGLRAYLKSGFGLYAELGLDKWSPFQVGLALKLPK